MIQLDGVDAWISRLNGIENRVNDAHPVLEDIRDRISAQEDAIFNAQGLPSPWARRVSDGQGRFKYPDTETHPVMDKTGNLRDSVASIQDGGGSISRIHDNTLEFGTDVYYGKFHQQPEELNSMKTGKMPVRRFLLFLPENIGEYIARIRAYLWWGSR